MSLDEDYVDHSIQNGDTDSSLTSNLSGTNISRTDDGESLGVPGGENTDQSETRPFEEAMHEVTWIKHSIVFLCDRYTFVVQVKHGKFYGKCRDCTSLESSLRKRKWLVNGQLITERTIFSLKFVNGLDGPIKGCPWKPGGVDHLCLKRSYYEPGEYLIKSKKSQAMKNAHFHRVHGNAQLANGAENLQIPNAEIPDQGGDADVENTDQSETRPFEEAMHEVTWIKYGSAFFCDRYRFGVEGKNDKFYGKCRDCLTLRDTLGRNNWIVNNRVMIPRKVSSLKFVNGLDGPIKGCPWKPGGIDHLCLDRRYYEPGEYLIKSKKSHAMKNAFFHRVHGNARLANGAENLQIPNAEMPDKGGDADVENTDQGGVPDAEIPDKGGDAEGENTDQSEARPFEEAMHEVTWIKYGSAFFCDRYSFRVLRLCCDIYGTCRDCLTLRDTLGRNNWIVNNRVMIPRKVCSLKFVNGLDGPIKGCPWKPGGIDHLCLDRRFYEPGEYLIKSKKSHAMKNAFFHRVHGNARLANGAEKLQIPNAEMPDKGGDADVENTDQGGVPDAEIPDKGGDAEGENTDQSETRPFEEAMHEVTWIVYGKLFQCDRYIFRVQQSYGKCRDCINLNEALIRSKCIINNRLITERTISSLKFVYGLDAPIKGCPWKPGGIDHLCLKRKQFEKHMNLIKISRQEKNFEILRENAHMLYGRYHDSDAESSDEDVQSDSQMPEQDDDPNDAESFNEDDQSDSQMPEQDDDPNDAESFNEDDQSDSQMPEQDAKSFDEDDQSDDDDTSNEENSKDRRVEEASYDFGNEQHDHNEKVQKSFEDGDEDGAVMPDQGDDPGIEMSDKGGDAEIKIADQSETRPFQEAMHEVTWIVYGKLFQCDLYQFEVCEQKINYRKTVLLGRCRDCYLLCRKLCKRHWIVADKRTSTLKFVNGLDGPVQGCPWKPGGLDHLCLKRNYYDRIMLQDVMPKLSETHKKSPDAESGHITREARKVKRATQNSKDNKTLNDITDESNFEQELELYRNPANNEKPKFTNGAIVKYFFIRPGNKCVAVKSVDIVEWLMQFTFYKNNGFEKVKRSVISSLSVYVESFRRIPGTSKSESLWQLRHAVVEDIPIAVDQIEERPYVVGEHRVNWIEYGKSFQCDKYIFDIRYSKSVLKDVVCRICRALRTRIQRRNWIVGNQLITNTKVCSLKFVNGLDGPVQGCPWKPGGLDHLCLKRNYYDRLIREDIIRERMQKADELLQQAIAFLKEKYENASSDFDIEAQEKNMKKFIKRQTLVFEYKEGTKYCFLYFIIKNGVLKYIGLSTDFNTRFCRHSETLTIFEDDGEVYFYIAPLGKRNVMFISDLEAAFIRLSKAGVLGKEIIDIDIINIDNGQFESVDENLKGIVDDPDHSEYPFLVDAFNEILKISLTEDNRVKPLNKVKNIITGAKVIQKNRMCRLEYIQQEPISALLATPQPQSIGHFGISGLLATPQPQPIGHFGISALLATPQPQPLGHSIPVQPELKIPIKYETLNKLAESQFLQFPFNARQKRYYLYFLKKKNSKKAHRYGITSNPARRQHEHENNKTLDGEFEMIEVPFPAVNRLFVMDLEAALIRLSKKSRLNDGKENMNKERDNGNFQSNVLQYLVEQEDTKLVEALDQLIQWALESNITVTSSLKRTVETGDENMNHSAAKRRMIFPSTLSSDRDPAVSEILDEHNFNFVGIN